VHDDGRGPALYVGGVFGLAGAAAASRIARWDGTSWEGLGNGLSASVSALASFDTPDGRALCCGGTFQSAADSGDGFLARWLTPADHSAPSLACPASVTALEVSGTQPGETVAFEVTAADDCDPSPAVTCTPPSGSFFPFGTTWVTCTATDRSGNQSTCRFRVTVTLPRLRQR
jgi:hypothetical protein